MSIFVLFVRLEIAQRTWIKHSGGHKLLENAALRLLLIHRLNSLLERRTDAGRLIHTGNCHLPLSLVLNRIINSSNNVIINSNKCDLTALFHLFLI